MKMAIFGGSGFIGSHLTSFFKNLGADVMNFSREPSSPYFWDPHSKIIDAPLLENCDVVINLAGENIFTRWSKAKKRRILESRLQATSFLAEILLKLSHPPSIYMGASAIGFYGDRGDESLNEESGRGSGFLSDVCVHWEIQHKKLEQKNMRVIYLRFGVVLGPDGGAYAKMAPMFKIGLGGRLGSGKQMLSWIHIDDLTSALNFIIKNPQLQGAINIVSPNPVSNAEMTHALGKVVQMPTLFNIPSFALTLLLGSASEIFLNSAKVIPKKLQEAGFSFQFPTIEEAFRACYLANIS